MQDNELYSYFRERKDSFNEVPDDGLWTKIDAGLNAAPVVPAAAKLTLIKKIALAAAATAITVTTAVLIYKNVSQAPEKVIPHNILPVREMDAVTEPVHTPEPVDTVKKKKAKQAAKIIAFRPVKDSAKVQKPAFMKFRAINVADSVIAAKPTVRTQHYGSTIKISTKEILSKAAFDTLVAQSLKTYRTQSGKILVVMADGHKPFRQVIGVMDNKQYGRIKGAKPVIDTLALPGTISFKKDSLKLNPESLNLLENKDTINLLKHSYGNTALVEKVYSDTKIYTADVVDAQPRYPGGIIALYVLLKNEMKLSDVATDTKIEITCVIEKDGTLSNITVKGGPPGIQERAEKALRKAKPWKPAKLNGKKVRCRYALPFTVKP